jgi:prefoldin subunit 1
MELQEQTNAYARDLRGVKGRIGSLQRDVRLNTATNAQIEPLSESTRLFRSVGKTFVLAPKADIQERLKAEAVENAKTIQDLNDRAEYLERRINSNTSNLRDLTAGL